MLSRRPYNPTPFPTSIGFVIFFVIVLGFIGATQLVANRIADFVPPSARNTIGSTQFAAWNFALGTFAGEQKKCLAQQFAHAGDACSTDELESLHAIYVLAGIGFGGLAIVVFFLAVSGAAMRTRALDRTPPKKRDSYVQLYVGKTTGELAQRGHIRSVAAGQEIVLSDMDVCQNTLVLGGIGSGKTTSALNRFVRDVLRQNCGGLFFDVKGDWGRTITAIAAEAGRPIERIGLDGIHMNLIAGLSPEIASTFLKSVMILQGSGDKAAAVYLNTAVDFARALLGVLHPTPHYNLAGLYSAVFDNKPKKLYDGFLHYAEDAGPEALEAYTRYGDYLRNFAGFEERIKSGARTTLSTILDAFRLQEIEQAFCVGGDDAFSMEAVLDGKVFLLDLPIAKYGTSAKTVYTMIKLRFFNVVDRRRSMPTWNQTRPVAFVCDEYQEVISVAKDAMSDMNFWDKSRSARCLGIISGQGYSSFRAVIGDDNLTRAVFQNFRQKICFTHEDPETTKLFNSIIGKGKIIQRRESKNRSFNYNGSSSGTAIATAVTSEQIVDEQLFRALGRGRALAIMQIDGQAYDDILEMPYYEPK